MYVQYVVQGRWKANSTPILAASKSFQRYNSAEDPKPINDEQIMNLESSNVMNDIDLPDYQQSIASRLKLQQLEQQFSRCLSKDIIRSVYIANKHNLEESEIHLSEMIATQKPPKQKQPKQQQQQQQEQLHPTQQEQHLAFIKKLQAEQKKREKLLQEFKVVKYKKRNKEKKGIKKKVQGLSLR